MVEFGDIFGVFLDQRVAKLKTYAFIHVRVVKGVPDSESFCGPRWVLYRFNAPLYHQMLGFSPFLEFKTSRVLAISMVTMSSAASLPVTFSCVQGGL